MREAIKAIFAKAEVKREMREAVIAIFVRVRGKKGNERGSHCYFSKS